MIRLGFLNPVNRKKIHLTQPQAWTVIAGLEALFAIASYIFDQGLGVIAGGLGVAAAVGARWYIAHPVIEYIEVEPSYSDEELAQGYELQRQAELLSEAEIAAREAAELEQVNTLIKGQNWQALDLPTPVQAVQILLRGEALMVRGHRVQFEPSADITWVTNPYGQDGPLAQIPNTTVMADFLAAMARGRTFGPIPE